MSVREKQENRQTFLAFPLPYLFPWLFRFPPDVEIWPSRIEYANALTSQRFRTTA